MQIFEFTKKYPIIGQSVLGIVFALSVYGFRNGLRKDIAKDNKEEFKSFKSEMMESYEIRFKHFEAQTDEAHELGKLFQARKEKCDEIQASLPVIRELMGKEEKKNNDIIELIRSEIKLAMGEIVNLEQNMRDILAGLR